MSESVKPIVAVVDDGELLLVREMLSELGVDSVDQAGASARVDREPVALLITNPRHALSSSRPPAQLHLVVYDNVSKMLRKALDRSGCDIALQAPLSSSVLRMLVERAAYRGPERRTGARAVVAAEVKIRAGLRQVDATLGQLSVRGCSLVLGGALAAGKKLKLILPLELAGRSPLKVEGTVVGSAELPSEYGSHEVSIRFDGVTAEDKRVLTQIVARHALPERKTPVRSPKAPATPAGSSASSSTRKPVSSDAASEEKVGADRRKHPRKLFRSQLLATGGGGSRLLFGCDLSTGGMRVRRDADLEVGDRLKLALHVRKGLPSVMLQAVVAHEGEDGSYGLSFVNVPEKVNPKLQQIVDALPPISPSSKAKPGVLVSEVLEHLGSEASD